MIVKALPISSDADNELYASPIIFDALTPRMTGTRIGYREATARITSSSEEKIPILIMDVKGLQRHNINEVLLKKLKIRGARTWFLTDIECVDDIFDAFNTDAEKVFIPTHTVRSKEEILDILDVSDSSIPTLFVRKGAVTYLKRSWRPCDLVDELSDTGFPSAAVIDTDGTVRDDEWRPMADEIDIIPCSFTGKRSPNDLLADGFRDVLTFPS